MKKTELPLLVRKRCHFVSNGGQKMAVVGLRVSVVAFIRYKERCERDKEVSFEDVYLQM